MPKNPKVHIPNTLSDILSGALSVLCLLFSWVYLLWNYAEIPLEIPVHFNYNGVADRFGEKAELFSLLGIGTGIYLALFVLSLFPEKLNYISEITEENAPRQYKLGAQLIRNVNFAISFVFSYLSCKTVYNVLNGKQNLDAWMTPVILIVIFAPLVYWLIQSSRK